MGKALKNINFLRKFGLSYFKYTALFVRVIPTDNCNSNCLYCYQKKINASNMSWDLFNQVLDKAIKLNVGFISFLGGEPMLWEYIYDAIALCSKHNILTDMTTNGTLLNDVAVQRLGSSGLDYLNVSVDTHDNYSVSKKNTFFNKSLIKALNCAKKNYGMKFRMNSVIYNNNFEDIKLLLELSNQNKIPHSLGFIVPNMKDIDNKEIYFSERDIELLENIVKYILNKKKKKYLIIDPKSYYTNVFRFIKQESFWKCNYPTKIGWINVTPNGAIRSCTKKMDETNFHFLSLTSKKIKSLKSYLKTLVKGCNPYCYSSCAYDAAFYKKNKIIFIFNNIF
ncbi:MAG: radical SAM protein [Treponema sp.]|jgi:MoaA/NifB/PqqE/SkfB family radical SAM enzyme|nr:radical SAM protein [Treponema sp.]